MKKDFTKTNEEHLIQMVKSLEPHGVAETVADWFGDLGLTISGWFGGLNINNYLDNIDLYHQKTLDKNNTTAAEVRQIFRTVRNDDYRYSQKISQIKSNQIEDTITYMKKLADIMSNDPGRLSVSMMTTQLGFLDRKLREALKKLKSPAYGEEPFFGGYQGSAANRWDIGDQDEIRAVVRKYFPDYSDAEIIDLLKEMQNEGCHYMALTNTIFAYFNGREEEFEQIFGFSMYDENGHPNFDLVMIDFYCDQGDINGIKDGLSDVTAEQRWEGYLSGKGVPVDVVRHINCTVDNYEELREQGEIIIELQPFTLKDSKGRDTKYKRINAGHAMVITGVAVINGKRMYEVSSWGDKYYIDPDDFTSDARVQYQQVRYN